MFANRRVVVALLAAAGFAWAPSGASGQYGEEESAFVGFDQLPAIVSPDGYGNLRKGSGLPEGLPPAVVLPADYPIYAEPMLVSGLAGAYVSADENLASLGGEDPYVELVSRQSAATVAPIAAGFAPIGHSRAVKRRAYFQAEATFLSREYHRAPTSYHLYNATNNPGGFNSTVDNDTLQYDQSSGSILNLEWNVGALSQTPTSSLFPTPDAAEQLTASPRLVIGIVGEKGWGIQGRYWRFENSVHSGFDPLVDFDTNINSSPTDMAAWYAGDLSLTSDFEVFETQTIDLELTRDFNFLGWQGVATFGARHVEMDNDRVSTVNGAIRTGSPGYNPNINQSNFDALLDTYHSADYDFVTLQGMEFEGTGPTFGLSGLRPISKRLSFFAAGRGSVLYGDSRNEALINGQVNSLFDDEEDTASQRIYASNELYIAEAQLGLEYSCPAHWMNGRFFARGYVEYQFWRNSIGRALATIDAGDLDDHDSDHDIMTTFDGNGSQGTVESGIGTTQGTATAMGLDPDFDLFGFGFSTGFVW